MLVVRDRSGQTTDFKLSVLDAAHVTEKLCPLIERYAASISPAACLPEAVGRPLNS